jgi:hypothetical protein
MKRKELETFREVEDGLFDAARVEDFGFDFAAG